MCFFILAKISFKLVLRHKHEKVKLYRLVWKVWKCTGIKSVDSQSPALASLWVKDQMLSIVSLGGSQADTLTDLTKPDLSLYSTLYTRLSLLHSKITRSQCRAYLTTKDLLC